METRCEKHNSTWTLFSVHFFFWQTRQSRDRISNFEDRLGEAFQTETKQKGWKWKTEHIMWNKAGCVTYVRREKIRQKKYLKILMAENFSKWVITNHRSSQDEYEERKPTYIAFRLLKIKDKRKSWRQLEKRRNIT